jgi:uncharacterized protein
VTPQGQRRYETGDFCWVGLATSDPDAAQAFYGGLFGWTGETLAGGRAGTFTILRLEGEDVAFLFRQTAQARAAASPPHWTSFVSVDDAHAAAVRAAELGGTMAFREPFEVLDAGRVAAIRDPTGGNLSLWQAGTRIGATVIGDVGALCWTELATSDVERVKSFFGELFGWTYAPGAGGGTTIRSGGRPNGSIRQQRVAAPDVMPGWTPSFKVESTRDAVGRAEQLGGRGLATSATSPLGRVAVIEDPQRAAFAVVEGTTNRATEMSFPGVRRA